MKCIVMFSGGLDSTIAVHLLKSMGLDVLALHFILPFYSGIGNSHDRVREKTELLGVPLRIIEEGEEYVRMFKKPYFGYGKNSNPCIDCRIHRLIQASHIMEEEHASFIATGEVMGQRPMSQYRASMNAIENHSGLKGLLLRPLSAKMLPPTIPEEKGWVNREQLLSFWGRGRKPQLAYAAQYNLNVESPGGGCLLTNKETSQRCVDLMENNPDFSLSTFKLVAYGRHFKIGNGVRLIIARNDGENTVLEKLSEPEDRVLMMGGEITGPLGIVRGPASNADIVTACRILARYTKARSLATADVVVIKNGIHTEISVPPAGETEFCAIMV